MPTRAPDAPSRVHDQHSPRPTYAETHPEEIAALVKRLKPPTPEELHTVAVVLRDVRVAS